MLITNVPQLYWRAFRFVPIILLLFLLLEIITRIAFFGWSALWHLWDYSNRSLVFSPIVKAVEDPSICWTLNANYNQYFRNTRFTTNEHGFRDRSFAIEKNVNVKRIAVLGRSTTMGAAVKDEAIYSRQLQSILDEQYPQQFEVLNFAVGAYRFPQMQNAYETFVAKFKPDAIIWPIYYDEIHKRVNTCPQLENIQPKWHELRGYFLSSFFYRAGQAWIRETFPWLVGKAWRKRGHPTPATQQTRAELLETFIQKRHQENIKVIVPVLFNINKIKQQSSEAQKQAIQNWIKPLTQKYAVQWVNTVPELIPHVSRADLTYLGDNHPNARVHRLYAESIARHVDWQNL